MQTIGWISWPHWLGTKRRTNKEKSEAWINFHAARKFCRAKKPYKPAGMEGVYKLL